MEWSSDQQQQLLGLVSRRHERDRLRIRLDEAKQTMATKQARQTELAARLAHEQADVDRLNGLSWSALYYSILNQKQERLTREEAEVADAELAYADGTEQLRQAEEDVNALTQQLANYASVDTDYSALIARKRALLHLRWDETGRTYDQLTKAVDEADWLLIETNEAGGAASAALNQLTRTHTLLLEARQLGYFDMFDGALTSLIKLDKLDQVRRQTHELTKALNQFSSEYADVGRTLRHTIDLDGWSRAGEVLFDNIFTDMNIQSSIDRAISTIEGLQHTFVPIINELTQQSGSLTNSLTNKADTLWAFLEQA
ncbi:hypothetical protein [Spirosoma arcticum]